MRATPSYLYNRSATLHQLTGITFSYGLWERVTGANLKV